MSIETSGSCIRAPTAFCAYESSASGLKEVWWSATDLTNRVSKFVSHYDRRMGIEEQFRDVKGMRFGMKLKWTQFHRAEFIERMYLLHGFVAVDERRGERSKSKSQRCGWRVRGRGRGRRRGAREQHERIGIIPKIKFCTPVDILVQSPPLRPKLRKSRVTALALQSFFH